MWYRNVCLALAIIAGVIGSLGCCCPLRGIRPPPIVVRPPAVVVQPPPPQPPPQDVQQFINQNLGANTYAGALAPKSPFWATLRQKVANRQYTTHKELGGGFGHVPFSETNAEGGVVIGFFAGDDGDGHVAYLQPIYLTAQGEKAGQAYGVARRPLQCLKAKAGYAVAGVKVQTGGVMDQFSVIFMKVDGERLNLGDIYNSPTIGGQGGGPGAFSTPNLIVGIHGKRLQNDAIAPAGAITGLGFFTIP